ncbi:MAG: glycosyltransferase [Gammaproteobacteria bacterium]|nr:glycosyltransferase [Gammaproteobacteria bacterium]
MTNSPSAKPVIYVHAKGRKVNGKSANKSLLELDLPVCSHLDNEGLTKTDNSYDQPGLLIAELADLFPGRPVLFLRAGLRPSKTLLNKMTGLLDQANQPLALTLLSNADNAVNPFAGLQAPSHASKINYAGLVNLLAPGQLHTLTVWADHIVMLSADLVTLLSAGSSNGTLMQQLATAGGALKAADHLFLHDPDHKVFRTLKLETYETAYPPPFSELSARLQGWFNADIPALPPNAEKNTPATLHITHSWGGGVAQWLKSFIETDSKHRHFQLRSEAPQTGRGYGQRMCLYLGNELRCPVASWWLNPPVESISDSHDSYQMILSEIYSRYGIGRVFVSSLVGHSIDVFRSGLPTLQILHDNFPAWPLLSVNPQPYLRSTGSPDLERALFEHRKDREFRDKNAQSWSQIRVAYLQAITEFKVKIAAPGQSVVEMQSQLAPVFKTLAAQVIPHGFPVLQNQRAILPKPREDGRLRMVIPGRMQTGKGQQLLARALPELAKHVQVYLVGTGKSGEAFFGMAGVNVIPEYERDQLASILTTIGPDFAALLSVVPETFSFTLSELQQLHIPTIATHLGNFPNRIEHGENGWLIDVDSQALVKQVITLCNSPDQIESVRTNLPKVKAVTLEDMLKAYNKLCPLAGENHPLIPTEAKPAQTQQAVADYQRSMTDVELQQALKWGENLQREVERRTEWALETGRHLKLEQKQRIKWVSLLKIDIENLQEMVAERQADLDIRNNQYQLLESDHIQLETIYNELEAHQQNLESKYQQLDSRFQQVSELNAVILGSSSWKIMRPLRVVRRVISNFMLARAWNPARWPWLISRLIGNLSTQGVGETLRRIQNSGGETIAEPQQSINTEPPNTELPGVEAEAAKTSNVANLDEGTRVVETTGIKATNVESENPENRDSDNTTVETIVSVPVGESNAPSAFPNAAQPRVSIIIPVFNQWAYTAACLTSLLEIKGKYDFELIMVDDQSSDETAHHLSRIEGLTHLRNKKNLGFVGGCNRGARHARGEYVVFLNNDTQVLQGWLDELIDTFDREPLAGLVGSRLVYPDGSLQESGGIIFNDGSGWNYGRDQNAEDPKYHFLRESDYVSGACIALKTKYFHELGAFDERYSPAYYEDTDLAFRVRESGRKVFIQPQSVIVHYEGVTSGTDTSSGTKKYQLINQKTFVERWQKALELQPEPVSDPFNGPAIRHASQHRLKGCILFIDATTPEPDKDSGSVRLTNLMQCFRDLGYGVTFFADNRGYAGSYTRDLQKTGVEVLFNPWLTSLHEFFRKRGRDFDYIFVSRHYIAVNYIPLIKRYCHHARFIFDTVDLHYLREQRLAELEQSRTLKRTSRLTRHSELRVIKAADATLVVSSVEKEVLSEDAPGEKVHVLSNIHQVPGRNKEYADRKDIYFVGSYRHPPNIDAACWFVNDIWPLIHRQLPDMRFHLIGGKAPERVKALSGDGVVFHGFVESLEPFLSDCRLAVAPLRYGAGVKGKVNMSMAHGQPVVATPAAAEGMFAENGRELLIAENAEVFASEVVRLYQDEELWNRLSDASVQNVEDHFSMAAARDSLTALFDSFEN